MLSSSSFGVAGVGTGVSHPVRIGRWLRSRLKIAGNTSQPPTTATRSWSSGVPFNHSKTDTLGFGPYSFLSMRGSPAPVMISL